MTTKKQKKFIKNFISPKKTLIEEIEKFLNYLQKNDFDAKPRQKTKMQEKFFFFKRISKLCLQDNLIEKDDEKLKYSKKIKTGFLENRFRITIKGLKFLEDLKKEKREKENKSLMNYLTLGLFSVAFLQGIIMMVYNFYDLKIRGYNSESTVYIIASLFFLIIIFIILINTKKRQ